MVCQDRWSFIAVVCQDRFHCIVIRPPTSRSYRIHLEVDKLPSREGDHDLSLVNSTLHYALLAGGFPLIHTFVRSNVTNAIGVNLDAKPNHIS